MIVEVALIKKLIEKASGLSGCCWVINRPSQRLEILGDNRDSTKQTKDIVVE